MGAGKTTVAGLLAEAWGVTVRDTDSDIEAAEGRTVSEIFVDSGEAYFRELEAKAVADALATHTGVLALGGGAVLDPATRAALAGHPRGVPARRPRRRGQAGRARQRAAAAARQRARPDQGAARRAHPGLRVGRRRRRGHRRADAGGRRGRRTSGAGGAAMADATVLPVRGASPYDVVVGSGLAGRLPGVLGRPWSASRCSSPKGSSETAQPMLDVLVEHYDVLALGLPARRAGQDRRCGRRLLGGAGGARLHPLRRRRDGRRWRDHRPRRLRGGDLAARRPGRARADDAARDGRRRGRRQDRHQHRPRARTSSAPSTSRPACCATSTTSGRCRAPTSSPGSARS